MFNAFSFQLRPSMERYQRAMVNIMTRGDAGNSVSSLSSDSESCPNKAAATSPMQTLTCPAGTLQDPSYLTVPFTASSDDLITARDPKRLKEQVASMFIAAGKNKLVIGKPCNVWMMIKNVSMFYVYSGFITYLRQIVFTDTE